MLHLQIASSTSDPEVNYSDIITYLASHTQAFYRGAKIGDQREDTPSFELHQTCCWICEKSLVNGMYMIVADNGYGNIGLIAAPEEYKRLDIKYDEYPSIAIPIGQLNYQSLQLLCGDCLLGMLEVTKHNYHSNGLIENPNSPGDPAENFINADNYIWPTAMYNDLSSEDCFRYVKRYAFRADYEGPDDEEGGDILEENPVSTGLVEHVFVEPNPLLPQDLLIKARNTIRLFKLNSKFYNHQIIDRHSFKFNKTDSNTFYEDLRILGRDQAHQCARTALNQLKNLRDLSSESDFMEIIYSQQRMIMELSGYRSVWESVFIGSGNSDLFIRLIDIPEPIKSRVNTSGQPTEALVKNQVLNIANPEDFYEATNSLVTELSQGEVFVDYERLMNLRERFLNTQLFAKSDFLEFVGDMKVDQEEVFFAEISDTWVVAENSMIDEANLVDLVYLYSQIAWLDETDNDETRAE